MKIISDGGISYCNIKDTMDAIMLTKNLQYIDGIKIDIQMSNDHTIVIAQDNDLSKFALSSKKIDECNYSYLRKIKYPSHIFKYYLPTLEEFLLKYNCNKIIILKIYPNKNIYYLIYELKNILERFPYKFYFISDDEEIVKQLIQNNYNNIGEVIDSNSLIKIIYDNNFNYNINTNDDFLFLITDHPKNNNKTNIRQNI